MRIGLDPKITLSELFKIRRIGWIKAACHTGLSDQHKELRSLELLFFRGALLTPSFFAWFFVMLSGFENLQNTLALHFFLELLESLFQSFIVSNLYS